MAVTQFSICILRLMKGPTKDPTFKVCTHIHLSRNQMWQSNLHFVSLYLHFTDVWGFGWKYLALDSYYVKFEYFDFIVLLQIGLGVLSMKFGPQKKAEAAKR